MKNDKVESWRGGKMSKVEIILVEIFPISALYYRFHTISILQVRKLVVQVTIQVGKNRPQKEFKLQPKKCCHQKQLKFQPKKIMNHSTTEPPFC